MKNILRSGIAAVAALAGAFSVLADPDIELSGTYTNDFDRTVTSDTTVLLNGVEFTDCTLKLRSENGSTFTIKLVDGTQNVFLNKNENKECIKATKKSNIVFTGGGTLELTSKKRIVDSAMRSGVLVCNNLTVEDGDITVTFDNNKNDTSCIFLKGNYLQTGGKVKVDMKKKNCTNELHGVTFDSRDTTFTLAGGKFTAEIAGTKSRAIDLKKSGAAYFNGGEVKAEFEGPGGRFVNGGTIVFAGTDCTFTTNITSSMTSEYYPTGLSAVKADASITVTDGDFEADLPLEGSEVFTTDDAEGTFVRIDGGDLDLIAGDDCIHARTDILVNGGRVRCRSVFDDALDANANLTISGGEIRAYAMAEGAHGLDVNNGKVGGQKKTLTISGGVVIATDGLDAVPVGSASDEVGKKEFIQPTYYWTLPTGDYAGKYLSLAGATNGVAFALKPRLPEFPSGRNFNLLVSVPGRTASVPRPLSVDEAYADACESVPLVFERKAKVDGRTVTTKEGDVLTLPSCYELTPSEGKTKTVTLALNGDARPALVSVTPLVDGTGVALVWDAPACAPEWVKSYRVYRNTAKEFPAGPLTNVAASATSWNDLTGVPGTTYWYWIEAAGVGDAMADPEPLSAARIKGKTITYRNLRGASHANPPMYVENYTEVTFSAPDAVTGYTFGGWTPTGVTKATRGDVVATASWTANAYTVSFDANGGEGEMVGRAFVYDAGQALPANAFVRSGFSFAGWAKAPDGAVAFADCATVSNLTAVADGSVTLYARWAANAYTVSFDANGGAGAMGNVSCTYGSAANLPDCAFARTGYAFAGWALEADGAVAYADGADCSAMIADNDGIVKLYAVWTANAYVVRFDANDGTGATASQAFVYDAAQALRANGFVRRGYAFLGWARAADGAVAFADGATVSNLTAVAGDAVPLFACWKALTTRVTLPDGTTVEAQIGGTITLPAAQPKGGNAFRGWSDGTRVYPAGGRYVVPATEVRFVPVYDPLWLYSEEATVLGEGETAPYAVAAAVYDGYVRDAAGAVFGSVQVKVAKGKVDKKLGAFAAKVTATVQLADGSKKISFKGGFADEAGAVTAMTAGGHTLALTLGVRGLGGSFDRYRIDGSRNLFSSKDAGDKQFAGATLAKLQGPYNVVTGGATIGIVVGSKGKSKVSGMVDGVKVSATGQLLIGADGVSCVPVVIFKKANLAFALWMTDDGVGVSEMAAGADLALAGAAGELKSGARFACDGVEGLGRALSAVGGELLGDYLPNGLAIGVNSGKWTLPKAGKVAFVKGTTDVDAEKAGENPSGLKLACKSKDGSFKGSFKAYAVVGGKVKAYTLNVTGVLVDGVGYGTAVLKKPAATLSVEVR